MDDDRFKHIKNDPKFRRIPVKERKVKIDSRFQSMFKDKKFKQKYAVDKRGKPVSHTSSEDLKRYYELSSEEEDESDESENDETEETGKLVRPPKEQQKKQDKPDTELNRKDSGDKEIPIEIKKKLKDLNVDYARGESKLCEESSSDDEESEEEGSDSEGIEHNWGELDGDAEKTEEATYRLAACNMDWDRIRAIDLMVLFNSFLNPGAAIKSIAIYPSEFGKERMKEEDVKGPIELVEAKHDSDGEEKEEGSKYHMEKLRQYQLNRLKYYYAIITCDSAATAKKIYTECDGMEYESSATKIDLRFVPDDMSFEDEPKEFCDKLPDSNKYQPRFFTTTALQQAKVDLTWDETDPTRVELTQKLANGKVTDFNDEELKSYVALSSSEDEDEEEKEGSEGEGDGSVEKYRALLQEIESSDSKKKDDVEMEISWGIDLKEKSEKLVKQRIAENESKTPFEQYLEKRKEKRKEKKKKKREEGEDSDDVPSDVDLDDPYFAEEFNKPEFKQKTKKSAQPESSEEDDDKAAELELLLSNEDDGKKHFNLKKIQESESQSKSKRNKRKNKQQNANDDEDNFEINVEDQRFAALFDSHHYNIDPTDPHFKKTKAMEKLISEKLKRRNEVDEEFERNKKLRSDGDCKKRSHAELNVLVKSVKNKARNFNKNL